MTPRRFRDIYRELIDENPLAVRAVLKVLDVEFTDSVPTLAVTCEHRPRLKVNLAFIKAHASSDEEVKAVVCHEFLHVLLRHTERFTSLTPAEHLALDAVINAIIHRTLGPAFSRFMSRYYADVSGPLRLLRPPTAQEYARFDDLAWRVFRPRRKERLLLVGWKGLYEGRLVADDIQDLAKDLCADTRVRIRSLIGGHDELCKTGTDEAPSASDAQFDTGSELLTEAVESALKSTSGDGIFRAAKGRGLGAEAYRKRVTAADTGVERWRREAYAVLRRHLQPDPRATGVDLESASFTLPVLSPGDRRASLASLWSPFLPEARWDSERKARQGSAQVYLDVSGSMNAEMPIIVALLGRLSGCIKRPFWAFSTEVAAARIEGGRLVADTTGGTSMACVLKHVSTTKPAAAVVVTDGYIEALSKKQVAAVADTRLHVIVTRDGSTAEVQRAGLPFTQLGRLPQ